MNIRMLSSCSAAALIFSISSSQAAVTVFGSGPAQFCYEAAESGNRPADNIAFCTDALSGALSPNDRAATLINRGVLELAMMKINAAQSDFDAGLAINATLGEGFVDRGATLIAQKRYAEAIADIDKGLALGTKQPHVAYFDRAMADEALGNLKAAYDDYKQALTLAPDFTLAADELKRFKVIQKPSGT